MSYDHSNLMIKTFLWNVFPDDIFYVNIVREKIKNYEKINPEIKVKKTASIYKFIILQALAELKQVYGIHIINIHKEK